MHKFKDIYNRGDGVIMNLKNTRTKFIEIWDSYEHVDNDLEYILESCLQENDSTKEFEYLSELFNTKLMNLCNCRNECESNCDHGEYYKVFTGPGSEINEVETELVLEFKSNIDFGIYECFEDCNCSNICTNRLVQCGPRKNLKIVHLPKKDFGLITEVFIPKGAFICEYAGELLTSSEAKRRNEINETSNRMNYILCLNEMVDGVRKCQTFIDPSMKGNIGRYLNHSCSPNCDLVPVRIGTVIPKIGIFANQNILSKEELTFSYGSISDTSNNVKRKPCFCGASNCSGFLPNLSF